MKNWTGPCDKEYSVGEFCGQVFFLEFDSILGLCFCCVWPSERDDVKSIYGLCY